MDGVSRPEIPPRSPLFQRGEGDSSLRIGSASGGDGRASAHARGEASRQVPPFEKGGQGGFSEGLAI